MKIEAEVLGLPFLCNCNISITLNRQFIAGIFLSYLPIFWWLIKLTPEKVNARYDIQTSEPTLDILGKGENTTKKLYIKY